jgi:hypothetical protein
MSVMSRRQAEQIRAREHRFPWFLLAVLLPILAMPFTRLDGNLFERLCLPVVGANLVLQSLRIMPASIQAGHLPGGAYAYRGLAICTVISGFLPYVLGRNASHGLVLLLLVGGCGFYLLTVTRIVKILARVEGVSVSTLCLGAAGYVHLGLTAGQLATFLEVLQPRSFNLGTMLPGSEVVERLTYFSFITLGSIGYGDILPATPPAEFFAVVLSIAGTLYMSLMIGLLLSRYINDQTQAVTSAAKDEFIRSEDV